MPTAPLRDSDRRILVLLGLAALILSADCLKTTADRQVSSYSWAGGTVVRSEIGREGKGIRLDAGTACADTPPELAAFFHLPLPVNRADQAALMRLPGIGPKLAENIIAGRQGQGVFAGPDGLLKVKGIGPKRLANLTPLICFDAN